MCFACVAVWPGFGPVGPPWPGPAGGSGCCGPRAGLSGPRVGENGPRVGPPLELNW